MGTLTQKERDALEDVFLSIHTSTNKSKKLQNFLISMLLYIRKFYLKKHLKLLNKGLKKQKQHNIYLKQLQRRKI